MQRPFFLVTIDTEGDDLWSRPRTITTRNAAHIPRFQTLCERHGLKPTYLTNYEMATAPLFRELGRDVVRRKVGEIGLHVHAWNNPPIEPLTTDDYLHQPYLIEYPEAMVREKVHVLTGVLEEAFGTKMVSHRAGRWAMNELYARILVEQGYRVDCSVTPGVNWAGNMGAPGGVGGTDYSLYPDAPYFIDTRSLANPGSSPLLEVPMTVRSRRRHVLSRVPSTYRNRGSVRRVVERAFPARWLRPRKGNGPSLRLLLDEALAEGRTYVQFMIHSSEFMPGGSPYFPKARDVDELFDDMDALFAHASGRFRPATLAEFYKEVEAGRA